MKKRLITTLSISLLSSLTFFSISKCAKTTNKQKPKKPYNILDKKNHKHQNLIGRAFFNEPEKMRLLLSQEADPNHQDPLTKETALIVAVKKNHPKIVSILLSFGAGPRVLILSKHGFQSIGPNMVPLFKHIKIDPSQTPEDIKYPLDVNIQDKFGYTAIQYALALEHKNILGLFSYYNIKPTKHDIKQAKKISTI